MIIIRLKGGLGNQMFQYALGRALSLQQRVPLSLDTSFYVTALYPKRQYNLDVFNVQADVSNKLWKSLFYRLFRSKKEMGFNFNKNIVSVSSSVYLDGYFQSPKYFAGFEEVIRKDFTLKNPVVPNIQKLAEEISSTNSLCIHVRRGDYVGNKNHDVVDIEYYKNGFDYISQKTKLDKIYVFSDEIKWCEDNLRFEIPVIFVGDEYKGQKDEWHMYLMSKCKHFVIANSSFSWWASWLSDNKYKIVVAPKKWFADATIDTSDLIPKEWIRI